MPLLAPHSLCCSLPKTHSDPCLRVSSCVTCVYHSVRFLRLCQECERERGVGLHLEHGHKRSASHTPESAASILASSTSITSTACARRPPPHSQHDELDERGSAPEEETEEEQLSLPGASEAFERV
jgi:hypothetical protein